MAKLNKNIKLSREQLDKKLQQVAKSGAFVPPRGWIRAIRESLGMSQAQLAKRLKVTRQSLNRMENEEIKGSLELKTLRKIANALSCELIYVFLPKKNLGQIVEDQALLLAKRIVSETEKHMLLENQGTRQDFQKKMIADLAEELKGAGKKIWDING